MLADFHRRVLGPTVYLIVIILAIISINTISCRVTIPKQPKKTKLPSTDTHGEAASSDTMETTKAREDYVDTQSQGDMLVTWDDTTSR